MDPGLRLLAVASLLGWAWRSGCRGPRPEALWMGGRKPGSPVLPSSLPPQVVLWQDHETGVRAATAQRREPERDLPRAGERDHER